MGNDKVADDLKEEFSQLVDYRRNFEEVWTEIQQNLIPRRTGFEVDVPDKGKRHDDKIYDGTPTSALNLWAQGTQGYLLSPSFKWAQIRPVYEDLIKRNRDVRLWSQRSDAIIFSLLGRSNFYKEMHEYLLDGGSFGTATMYIYEDIASRRLWFSVRHPREIYIAENDDGIIDTIFRLFEMSYRNMITSFGGDDLHKDIRKRAEGSEKYETSLVLHVVKPNEKFDPDKADAAGKKFSSWYVDYANDVVIRKGGFHENPYGVWRMAKNSDEYYGRGPGWDALADCKSLHQYSKTNTTAAEMFANPALDIPDERRGLVMYRPGGRSYYEETDRQVRLLPTTPGYHIAMDREDQKRTAIERAYMVPFFLMMANAEKEMTATEIRNRLEEKAIVLGPMITGLNHDLLDPLFDRIFGIAYRAGWLPPAPPILLQAGGELEIDYMGPLSQAQRRHFQSEPYRASLVDLAGVAQFSPTVTDNFNWDFVAKEVARANGWAEEGIHSDRVVAEVRQLRQQMQQQQQQQEQLETLGKAAPGLNEPVKEDSMLGNIGEAAAAGR